MGEYLSNGVKVGTCENLYYATFAQLKKSVNCIANSCFLKESNGYRYRFPFPDEKNIEIGMYENFDRGLPVVIRENNLDIFSDVDHGTMFYRVDKSLELKHSQIGAILPCPYEKEKSGLYRFYSRDHEYNIVQQKQVNGKLWLVMDCPLCGTRFRLPPEDGMRVAQSIIENECLYSETKGLTRMQWVEVAIEIVLGYELVVKQN